ncbi:MAG: hypothetical protein ACOWWO_19250 [Peptococcaceae bacterium]
MRIVICFILISCASLLLIYPLSAAETINGQFLVGKDNKLNISLTGPSGYGGGLGTQVEDVEFNYYFTKKVEGEFFADSSDTITNDLKKEGRTTVTVFADTPGEVTVVFSFRIEYKNTDSASKILTKKFTFNFVPEKEKKILGFMYVRSEGREFSPYAAYEKDGKVYLPLDITMQIIGAEQPFADRESIVDQEGISFIEAKIIEDKYNVEVEKVLDYDQKVSSIRLVQYILIEN